MSDPTPPPAASSRFHALRRRLACQHDRANLALVAVLLLLFLGTLVFLGTAEKPWGPTVQKRLAKEQRFNAEEYGIIGLWWGAVANAGVLAALLAASPWWLPHRQQKPSDPSATTPGIPPTAAAATILTHPPRWLLWGLTAAALSLALWERAPRMNQSLWNDEEYAMRRFAHGAWESKDDEWRFKPAPWADTFFANTNGNNHLLNSLTMRLSLNTWRAFTGAPREAFSEVALRMPALLMGLATLALIVVVGREAGIPLAGVAAAFLLALSPWHLHYSTDAKGYSGMFFFIVLSLLGIIRALRTNQLRWWLLFALAQAAYLLSFAGSIYVAAAVNLIAATELLCRRQFQRLPTLIAFNLIAVIIVVQWMAPAIPQLLDYLGRPDALRLGMGKMWLLDTISSLYLGFPYENRHMEAHLGTSWLQFAAQSPAWLSTVYSAMLIPLLCGIGFLVGLIKSTATRLIIVAPVLAGLLAFAHNAAADNPMVIWYLLYLLIPLSFMLPLAVTTLTARVRWLAVPALVLLISGYALATWEANDLRRKHDRQPIRQTVAFMQSQHPEAHMATFGVSDRQSLSYAPKVRLLKSAEDLTVAEAAAQAQNLPLFVFFCGEHETAGREPAIMQQLRESGRYAHVRNFPGLEELFSYQIFQHQP